MWITIRTRRTKISMRLRETMERYIRRTLQRERSQVASIAVYLTSRTLPGGDTQFQCRLVLWSQALGKVVVSETETTIRRAVREATLKAREVIRRNTKRRISRRRRLTRNRLNRYFDHLADSGAIGIGSADQP
jgi:hypothetical protein